MSKKETLHIYVRCSTDSQIETSIERQKEMGIKFSKEMGMDYKIWTDEGKSGIKSFEDTREQFTELMWEVELGSVKHLWCEDFTRLTRNYEDGVKIEVLIMDNDLFVYEGLLNNQIYQPNELSQRLIKVVTSMIGTDMKKGEIQKGINQKIKMFNDGLYKRGNWSFGYDKEGDYLVVNDEEGKWVKKIFEWYGVEQLTIPQISKKLKMYGVKTKRGNDWGWESVRVCLKNKNYIGIDYYTDMTKDPHRKNPKKFPYPDESKWVVYTNDNLPKIVSDELFQKCQKLITHNKPQPTKYNYLLHGRIKCHCGNDWVGRKTTVRKTEEHYYYMCNNSSRSYYKKVIGRNDLYEEGICNKIEK